MQCLDQQHTFVCYEMEQIETVQRKERKSLAGNVLVFASQEEVTQIKTYFETKYDKSVSLSIAIANHVFQEKKDGLFGINQTSHMDYEKLVQCLEEEGKLPSSILFAWSFIQNASNSIQENLSRKRDKNLDKELDSSIYAMIHLLKAIIKVKPTVKVQIIYAFPKHINDAVFAALDGLGKSIRTENPKIAVKTVAFLAKESSLTEEKLEQLCIELESEVKETYIEYKDTARFVPILKQHEKSKVAAKRIRPNQTYLITGGLGKIGYDLAQYLVEHYNASLILTGRTGENAATKEKVDRLNKGTNQVLYCAADLTERSAIEYLRDKIEKAGMKIAGIFHCAGCVKDNFFIKKTVEEVKQVIEVKVKGLEYLYEFFQAPTLEFMVMFSSISSIIGTMGQIDYAYANSFMNHFSRNHSNKNIHMISINWPLWEQGGMDTTEESKMFMKEKFGIVSMPSEEGIPAVMDLLEKEETNYTVFYGDKVKIEKLVEGLNPENRNQGSDKNLENHTQVNILEEENIEYLREKMHFFLKQLFINETKIPESALDIEDSFEKIGFDSIMAMNLNQELEKVFGELAKTLLFEYPTIKDLADYFMENHLEAVVKMFPVQKAPKIKEHVSKTAEITEKEKAVHQGPVFRKGFSKSIQKKEENKDIAIIGISGKFPMSSDLKAFWENLKVGQDCITEVPKDRWDIDEYYTTDKNEFGKMYCKWGGFVDDIDKFDAQFFHISAREAEIMDPQERLFLQCSYSAMEDAGYTRPSWEKERVGVFVGVMYGQYQMMDAHIDDVPLALSSVYASIANRVSYHLNLHGPSIALDTMCSSSLTSVHLACDSIRKGESDYAIAGGVNVSIHPNKYVFLSQQKFMASDGRCRSFGEGGDGYVPGEGVGAIVLKPMDKAVADGDHIYGVIKASAINHGGKATGYTVPNPVMQASVIKDALEYANINPRTINYMEAHGTGTSLGDPIEISGLQKVFKEYTKDKQFCAIGSVKSNIGHLESAAGVAAIIKVLLQMKYKKLVPSIHSDVLNENIDFDSTPFYVQRTLENWDGVVLEEKNKKKEYPRRAGISAFGAGGSNAHILMEEYIPRKEKSRAEESKTQIIILSALSEKRLKEYVQSLYEYLQSDESNDVSLQDIAYTLVFGREEYAQRVAFLAESKQELLDLLKKYFQDEKSSYQTSQICSGNIHDAETYSGILNSGKEGGEFLHFLMKEEQYLKIMQLWVLGVRIDWSHMWEKKVGEKISLPTYPFDKKRFWIAEIPTTKGSANGKVQTPSITEDYQARFVQYNLSGLDGYQFACQVPDFCKKIRPMLIGNNEYINSLGILALVEDALNAVGAEQYKRLVNINWSGVSQNKKDKDMLKVRIIQEVGYFCCEVLYGDDILLQCEARETQSVKMTEWNVFNHNEVTEYNVIIDDADIQPESEIVRVIAETIIKEITSSQMAPYSMEELQIEPLTSNHLTIKVHKVQKDDQITYEVCWFDEERCVGSIGALQVMPIAAVRVEEQSMLYTPKWELCEEESVSSQDQVVVLSQSQTAADCVKQIFNCPIIPLGAETDYEKLVQEINTKYTSIHKIVYLAGEQQELEQKMQSSIYGVFHLTKELLKQKGSNQIQLSYFYCNFSESNSDRNDSFDVFDSALGGFMRTVKLENPNFNFSVVGVAKEDWNTALGEIVKRELSQSYLPEVRYMDKKRYQKKMHLMSKTSQVPATSIREGGIYLITGGMGGLGRIFAEYLVKKYHVSLILTGRSKLNEEKKQLLTELQVYARNVEYVQNDASKEAQVTELLQYINKKYGALHGILHCAGTNNDSFLLKKTQKELDNILYSKVISTLNLGQAGEHASLDFIMLFSSIAGVSGNLGQADYAYANQFMNDYARQYQKNGRCIAVAWPLWESEGMNLSAENRKMLEQQTGLTPITVSEGVQVLEQALAYEESVVVVTHGKKKYLEHFVERLNGVENELKQKKNEKVVDYDKKELLDQTMDYLLEVFSHLLKVDKSELSTYTTFDEYGIESILVGYFNTKLEEDLGSVSKTLLFEYQTIKELAEHLSENYVSQLLTFFKMEKSTESSIEEDVYQDVDSSQVWKTLTAYAADKKAVQRVEEDDIAIIGVSGKYPMADNIYEFWNNLLDKKDCITEIPLNRWDYRKYFDGNYEHPQDGKMYSKWGGFVSDVDKFDAAFFHIAPKEANIMDPQERMFLETAYAALEDAGYPKARTRKKYDNGYGANVGVFAGTTTQTYQLWGPEEWERGNLSSMPNVSPWSIANRISYLMNFSGPSIPVDTACSSSLTAVYLACESLKRKECEMAVAGGVNLYLHPYKYVLMCQTRMLSPTGKCHSFSNDADGFAPGEGVGAIILKPLKKAVADRDFIYGVIRAAEINHGGKTSGYTVPNPNAQSSLIQNGLRHAGIDAEEISYIESHGTGTKLGDPIEINALNKVFQGYNVEKEACAIGSVKSNIGHSEAAAGIASITKVIMQLKHKKLAPSIHGEPVNENIDFKQSYFHLQTEVQDWNPSGKRIAGVSSFGAGGANGYVLIEEYTVPQQLDLKSSKQVIVLSAQTEDSLINNARNIYQFLKEQKEPYYTLENIAYTLQVGREEMKYRVAFLVDSMDGLLEELSKLAKGENFETLTCEGIQKGIVKIAKANGQFDYEDLAQLAKAYVEGYTVEWETLHKSSSGRIVPLPTYAFSKDHFWIKRTEGREIEIITTEQNTIFESDMKFHPLLHKNCSTFRRQYFETVVDEMICRQNVLSEMVSMEMVKAAVEVSGENVNYRILQASFNPNGRIPKGKAAVTSLYENNGVIEWEIGYYQQKQDYIIAAQGYAEQTYPSMQQVRFSEELLNTKNQYTNYVQDNVNAVYQMENQVCIMVDWNSMWDSKEESQFIQEILDLVVELAASTRNYTIHNVSNYLSRKNKKGVCQICATWAQTSEDEYCMSIQMTDVNGNLLFEVEEIQVILPNMEGANE